jgi:S-formylglutathione hydrolase FrmB
LGSGVTTRRAVLIAGGGAVGLAAAGLLGWPLLPGRVKRQLGLGPEPVVPDAPEGVVRLETVPSVARGTDVQLFTAVPDGFGDGAGLPVVVVLHGASATAADFQPYGLPRFLTAAVEAGAPPFALAGADGGVLQWEPQSTGDDPQTMVVEEIPRWLDERGFDAERRALWGWSMGGYGALRLAEAEPGWARATAAFSPAVSTGDAVSDDVAELGNQALGIWCGTEDPFLPAVSELVDALPTRPEIVSFEAGEHGRVFWNQQTPEAFAFLARHLA